MLHVLPLMHASVGGVLVIGGLTGLALGEKLSANLSGPLTHSLAQLTWLITQISLLLAQTQNKAPDNLGGGTLLVTEILHVMVFFSASLLAFFIFYESVLIPLTLLIAQGGSGAGRLRAGILFFTYTLGGSAPMLIATLFLVSDQGDMMSLGVEAMVSLCLLVGEITGLWLAFGASFAVKTPLYPFLVWLIHAHAEAPLEGSIILAGIVLKLAIFGVSAVLLALLWAGSLGPMTFTLTLGLCSLLLASLAMLQQLDLKGFVALSSVAHMGMGTLGILSLREDGMAGAWLLALAHGLVSPCLFLIAGGFIYKSFATRLIYPFRGIGVLTPFMGLTFLLATLANMATPLSPNWVAEVLIFVALAYENKAICLLSSSSITLGAVYSIWLYNRLIQGNVSPLLRTALDMPLAETFTLTYILFLAGLCGIFPYGTLELYTALSWVIFI